MIALCPPNLRALGWRRQTPLTRWPDADLKTIWSIPEYPVIGNYKKLCADTRLAMFGGGTIADQGDEPGLITSGYRDDILDGNDMSPHHFGFALDIWVGGIKEQIRIALASRPYFSRVGLYPDSEFIHVDMAPDVWIERYNKSLAWVKHNGIYHPFVNRAGAIDYVGSLAA